MGRNDHMYDVPDVIVECSHCNKKYSQGIDDQVAGFRSREFDYCPYCGKSNGSSMQVEYHNHKID